MVGLHWCSTLNSICMCSYKADGHTGAKYVSQLLILITCRHMDIRFKVFLLSLTFPTPRNTVDNMSKNLIWKFFYCILLGLLSINFYEAQRFMLKSECTKCLEVKTGNFFLKVSWCSFITSTVHTYLHWVMWNFFAVLPCLLFFHILPFSLYCQ